MLQEGLRSHGAEANAAAPAWIRSGTLCPQRRLRRDAGAESRAGSLCPALGAAWPGTAGQCLESRSPLGSCGWLLFVSRYLILFRNELIHCFKNILWCCVAIISVLNGLKARIAGAFTKAKQNIYLVFKNNQKR